MKLSTILHLQNLKHAAAAQIIAISGHTTAKNAWAEYKNIGGKNWTADQRGAYCLTKPQKLVEIDVIQARRSRQCYLTLDYESRCNKWGQYNPHQYFVVETMRHVNSVAWLDVDKTEICHGSTTSALRRSTFYLRRNIKKNLDAEYIKINRDRILIGHVAHGHGMEFHALNMHDAMDGLTEKLQIQTARREQAAAKNLVKKQFGTKITRQFLINHFGWCPDGINDFIADVLPCLRTQKSIRAKTLKRILRNKKVNAYRTEVAELKMFIRHA